MAEFNPDGSLKLPESLQKIKDEKERRMTEGRCITIKKDVVSTKAPKKCVLHLTVSNKLKGDRMIQNIHKYASSQMETPTKLTVVNESQVDIEIGTEFKRCQECTKLCQRYKDYVDSNVIEEQGNCAFEPFKGRSFSYEDYFD